MIKLNKDEFINRIESIFGENSFDYSLLDYKGAHQKVKLICCKCGNVEEKDPSVFYRGFGCIKCNIKRKNPKRITKEQFLIRSKLIHGSKYDYSKINYVSLYENIEIICPKHGSFFTKPTIHIHAKSNCPECKISKGEEEIGIWLNDNNQEYIFQYKVKINNSNHYFDFYLPKINTIIEFNGMQHYKPIKFFGGVEGFKTLQIRDKIKEEYCIIKNIKLITISYKDNIEEKIKKCIE